jgi:hypothetical protein
MERVRKLSTGGRHWVVDSRLEGALYRNDPLTELKGCGPTLKGKFEAHGIKLLGDLCALDEIGQQSIVNGLTAQQSIVNGLTADTSLTARQVSKFKELAKNAKDEDAPEVRDYRDDKNPYLSRYGEHAWEEKIDACFSLSPFVCVTKLVEHMWTETEKIFEGSKYENDWFIYHDALSLMTASDTKKWMEDKDYLKRWIRPKLGLFDEDPSLKAYRDRPPGDRQVKQCNDDVDACFFCES